MVRTSSRPGVLQSDRALTTTFKLRGADGADRDGVPPLWVSNAHLSAGPEARRRLRQVHEALEAIRKARDKAGGGKGEWGGGKDKGGAGKGAAGSAPPLACVFVGDMNSQGASAVRQLLLTGEASVLPVRPA